MIHRVPKPGAALGGAQHFVLWAVCLQGEGDRPALNELSEKHPDNMSRCRADFIGHALGLAHQRPVNPHSEFFSRLRTHVSIM